MIMACLRMESKTESPVEEDVDKDLQLIFKKLRVDSKPKRLSKRSRVRSHSWSEGSHRLPHPREKPLIKEPTFLYKSKCLNFKSQARKLGKFRKQKKKESRKELAKPVLQAVSDTLFTSEPLPRNRNVSLHKKYPSASCGGQFRKAQFKTVKMSSDDTTPEELAAYFELLHIPKPMSAMAEMMYT